MRRLSCPPRIGALVGCLALAPAAAYAGEPEPFRRGGGQLGLAADASIASALTLVGASVRGGYFVRAGLELGAEVQTVLLLGSPSGPTPRPIPGDRSPNAAFRIAPYLRWMPVRTPGFVPYLLAGVGPGVLSRGGGVLGHAIASPGALVHLGGRVWLDLAIRFSASFPRGRCFAAFTDADPAAGFCTLQFGPHVGLVAAF